MTNVEIIINEIIEILAILRYIASLMVWHINSAL